PNWRTGRSPTATTGTSARPPGWSTSREIAKLDIPKPRRDDPAMKDGDDGPVHILSLGAGVQSSAMALMAAQGLWEDMPALAVFADTQAESRRIYDWLDWIEKNLPYPVVRVTNGSLTEESLRIRQRKDGKGCWSKSLIPAFIKDQNGNRGIMGRACTADYKVKVIVKHAREQVIGKAGLQAWRARHREALREIRAHEAAKAALRR